MRNLKELSNSELIELAKTYDMGELLSTEDEIDYVMSRIGNVLKSRPVLVNYTLTNTEKDFFAQLEEQRESDDEF